MSAADTEIDPESGDSGGGDIATPTTSRFRKPEIILITGAARSGTSLVTRILADHGVRLGDRVNELYENVEIRQQVLKPHLQENGCDPIGQRLPFPETDAIKPDPRIRAEVNRILPARKTPRAYKDAKLTLSWRAWADAFPKAKWIIVRRNIDGIIDSCLRTHFMRAYQTRAGWERWVLEHERRFDEMKEAGLDLIEVWPRQFIGNPLLFGEVTEFCGLSLNVGAVRDAVNPRLYR